MENKRLITPEEIESATLTNVSIDDITKAMADLENSIKSLNKDNKNEIER